jgi:DNA-directed RNA polymerase subunit RPC12/RpoP
MKKPTRKFYKCLWCGEEFYQAVVYDDSSKKNSYSSIVTCPNCTRTIPTWEKEKTGEVVGKTHIHKGR